MAERHSISLEQSRALISRQFPELESLPMKAIPQSGTDHALFRLGDALCARFPIVDWAQNQPTREAAILSALPDLPLAVPRVRYSGVPGAGYPWNWSILDWLPGAALGAGLLSEPRHGVDLAVFLRALHSAPGAGLPPSGSDNHFRGAALSTRDAPLRKALEALVGTIDTQPMLDFWDEVSGIPVPSSEWGLIHGDLTGGNVILRDGQVSGVIDWGLAGVGDTACDGLVGWSLLEGEAREVLWAEMGWSDQTRKRAMAWSLAIASIAQAHYRGTGTYVDKVSARILRQLALSLRGESAR